MSKKKKIIYTVLLGIMAIFNIYLIYTSINALNSWIHAKDSIMKHDAQHWEVLLPGYKLGVLQNVINIVLSIVSFVVIIMLNVEIWNIKISSLVLKFKYSYKDYKEEKLKKKELKKQKQREKLEQKLKRL